MKKRTKVAGLILVIVFAYIYAHVAKTDLIYNKQTDTSDYISLGVSPYAVEQEFICSVNRLDGIAVKCQLSGDTTNIKVCMDVKDVERNEIVASTVAPASTLKNGKFNVFEFETVEDSKGHAYKVSLYNEGNEVDEGHGAGFVCQPKTEEKTILSVGGEQREGTLIMKTVTKGFDAETFCVLLLFILYIVIFFKFLFKLFAR